MLLLEKVIEVLSCVYIRKKDKWNWPRNAKGWWLNLALVDTRANTGLDVWKFKYLIERGVVSFSFDWGLSTNSCPNTFTLEKSDTKNCLNIFNVTSVKTRAASNSNLVGNHQHNWNQRWFSFSYLNKKWEYKPFCNAIHKLTVGSTFKALSSLVPSLAFSFSLLVVLVTYLKVNIIIIKTSIARVILDF